MLLETKNPADCANNQQGLLKTKTRLLTLILGKFIVSESPTKGKATMDIREQKGLQIAASLKLTQSGNRWFVPSQSNGGTNHGGKYIVKPDVSNPHCSCPDFEFRQRRCKHIFAVEYTLRREQSADGQMIVTETLKVTQKTYSQDWPAYNAAQVNEKDQFQVLLRELCNGVGEPSQKNGRPRLPLDEMIFATAFKVYSTVSQRRFMSDLRDAHAKGYISKVPHFNSISNYLENEALTPYLKMLIEESSLPLTAIESDFAVDSSGFSTCRFVQWVNAKYTNPQLMTKREWIKVHLMCGVKTNIVTAVEVSDRYAGDSPFFKQLVDTTAENFVMQEVSADKAYLSAANLQTVIDHAAMPYIPFKSNSASDWGLSGKRGQDSRAKWNRKSTLWRRMYHYYSYNQTWFMQQYHKRSNVESTFHMIKSKFGDALRSKTETAQINEALCKVLCHNLCCLIQSMFELDIKAEFWTEAA
jgi:transposase/predicted nucleic acid-binding Zn finger protein